MMRKGFFGAVKNFFGTNKTKKIQSNKDKVIEEKEHEDVVDSSFIYKAKRLPMTRIQRVRRKRSKAGKLSRKINYKLN